MLEGCQNVKVLVDSLLSSIEVINSKKITIQVKGQLPQFSIERTEGINIYVSKEGKNCKFHSTCSQSMVVHYP
jgi:adenylyl cyclase-associated protein